LNGRFQFRPGMFEEGRAGRLPGLAIFVGRAIR